MGQPSPAVAENGLAARVARARRRTHGTVTAAAANAVAQDAPAYHWARCGSVCGMSTTKVEATRRAMRGSRRLTVTVARHEDGGGGPMRRWSEEQCAAPMCPTSLGRRGVRRRAAI
jgi:hypothetical protein